ncbi:MAG: response regulator transcription factor, partial [Deltaproteobacteria bacterium]|nr:response regulator transcription factor [Deltaproteobacteria bacterium]
MDIGNISRNNKILIIEDDLTTKAVLEDMLRSNGYQTRHAACGADGLKAAGQWFPAVILLDLIMPGMSGIDVCKELRAMKLPYRPSIIIVSVKSGGVTIAEALSSGADDFIVKPVNQDELIARIKAQRNINAFYAEMENDKKNLETMLAITNAMQSTLDPAEVLDIIVHKVAEVTT